MSLTGTITALITPFTLEGKLDEEGLKENIKFQEEGGVDSLLLLGSTGEGEVLTPQERRRVIELAFEVANLPLIVGVGSLSTAFAVERAQEAERMGASGILAVTPYYNRPSQEGLYHHFESVAASTSLPLLLYHNPKRTGVALTLETVVRLAKISNIVGIKECSDSLSFAAALLAALPEFIVLTGDDVAAVPLLSIGGQGVVSILSNLLPDAMVELVAKRECSLYRSLYPFMELSTCASNPIPIKAMMEVAGFAAGSCRPPLTPLSSEQELKIRDLILYSPLVPKRVYES